MRQGRNGRFILAAISGVIVLVLLVLLPTVFRRPAATPTTSLVCIGGSEKTGLMADPAVKTRLAELGNEIEPMTPAELAAFLGKEDQTVADLAKTGLLKPE